MKGAFTLVEIIVVVIIIGMLAALALPRFTKAFESTKAQEAVAALNQIRTGEKIYKVEENIYWPAGSTETNVATINSQLRLFLDTRELNWDYYVTATANTFTATAKRQSGANQNETITIDQTGAIDKSGWSP